jgi:hypothetical protein
MIDALLAWLAVAVVVAIFFGLMVRFGAGK